MSQSSEVFSTKQVADSLGLGAAMVRKYAVALEKLTGEDIPLKRRDGRQFDRSHFDTISKAKALVDNNNGLNIETALKMALGTSEMPSAAPGLVRPDTNTLDLTQALSTAVERGNEPLLAELRQLRLELRQLQTIEKHPAEEKTRDSSQHGLLVRAAMRLEALLNRLK